MASPAFDVAAAAQLLEAGTPAKEVAQRYQVSEGLISKRCRGTRKAWLRRRDELIRTLVRGGYTRAQAAKVARCSFGTAQRACAGLRAVTAPARKRQARREAAALVRRREADPLRFGPSVWDGSGDGALFPTWD